jgi:hypothetical protein
MSLVSVYEISRRKASLSNKRVKESLEDGNVNLVPSEGDETVAVPTTFIPKNPSACPLVQSLFMDEKSADIVIQVIEKQNSDPSDAHQSIFNSLCGPGADPPSSKISEESKPVDFFMGTVNKFTGLCGPAQEELSPGSDIKAAPATFFAHNFILLKCSSTLAELSKSGNPIRISNLSPEIFRFVLSYMYGFPVAKDNMKENSKEIMEAADWMKVTNLKLEAEAAYVESITFTVENVMEHLLYADLKKLSLLKEASLDFIMTNKTHVLQKVWTDNAPQHILADILTTMAGQENTGLKNNSREGQFSHMRISELRKIAYLKGLDLGGSREMLIAALQEST